MCDSNVVYDLINYTLQRIVDNVYISKNNSNKLL